MQDMAVRIATVCLLAAVASARVYTFQDNLSSFDQYDFITADDPTHGFVNYVSKDLASQAGLIDRTPSGGMRLNANHKHVVNNPRGRSAVRIQSKKMYNPGTLFVADINHMPTTCGSWPAMWLLGADGLWPTSGEVDWIEGGNILEPHNLMTLHTTAGCKLNPQMTSHYIGILQSNIDCNVAASSDNSGCSIKGGQFGQAFKGGVYVLEWAYKGFNIWFFPHGQVPATLTTNQPDVAHLGKPIAQFAGNGCHWRAKFRKMKFIINTTFCGDWAGNVWKSGGCAAKTGVPTCVDFVRNHPAAFKDAFWDVSSVKVFARVKGNGVSRPPAAAPGPKPSKQPAPKQAPKHSPRPSPGKRPHTIEVNQPLNGHWTKVGNFTA